MSARSSKRVRRKPSTPYSVPASTMEEKLLQQAIANSRVETSRPQGVDVPVGPTFYPTVEEFTLNPLTYIEKIRPIAEKYGICKVVPPPGWNPPLCVDMKSGKQFETKNQKLHRLQEGVTFGDGDEYTPGEYMKMASETATRYQDLNYDSVGKGPVTPEKLEQDYWKMVDLQSKKYSVEYGNDIDTGKFWSGFPLSERGRAHNGSTRRANQKQAEPAFGTESFYKETWWNLNNISSCPGSVLRHVKCKITGINIPWLYFGCLFSTFCWHNEDNYLYSINYHHSGAPKQWYGVPGTRKDADGLERIFKNNLSMKMKEVPDLLHHITTMFSPRLLQQANIPVYKLLQHPGEFVVTFPRAFHGGFSMGPNIGEAVNFATSDWISHGSDASERYRSYARSAVFSHDRLTFTLARYLEEHSLASCIMLAKELERVISEELRLRTRLLEQGVRDVSSQISLPKNRLDQLDESSADYDDKRLCFSCKHVCFFSAVACECSQSKVSCLRHSHYMCRCPTHMRYMMMWSTVAEMTETLERVQKHITKLSKEKENTNSKDVDVVVSSTSVDSHSELLKRPNPECVKSTQINGDIAPGAEQDKAKHKNFRVDFSVDHIENGARLLKPRIRISLSATTTKTDSENSSP